MILKAKKRILISDWYLSPGLYLIRSQPLNKEYRLDKLLFKKAKEVYFLFMKIFFLKKRVLKSIL